MTILHFSGWLATLFIYPDPKFKSSYFSWKIWFFLAFFFFFGISNFSFCFTSIVDHKYIFLLWYFSLFNNLLSNFFVTWFFCLCYFSPHVSFPPEYVLKYIPLLVMKKILIFSCVCVVYHLISMLNLSYHLIIKKKSMPPLTHLSCCSISNRSLKQEVVNIYLMLLLRLIFFLISQLQ